MGEVGGFFLLGLGPAGATAAYWALYRHYRNTDQSHAYEHETKVGSKRVTGTQRKLREAQGLDDKRIRNENTRWYRQRVRRVESAIMTGRQT